MRLPLLLAALVLLSGCSTVATVREAWDWDPSAMQERSVSRLSTEQRAVMTNRLADLQLQRNEIRSRISAEPDIRARQRLYADLHAVGQQLSPLERQLIAAAPTYSVNLR